MSRDKACDSKSMSHRKEFFGPVLKIIYPISSCHAKMTSDDVHECRTDHPVFFVTNFMNDASVSHCDAVCVIVMKIIVLVKKRYITFLLSCLLRTPTTH